MQARRITPGSIVSGPGLAEPLEVFAASTAGSELHVAGLGLSTGQRHVGVWAADQISALTSLDPPANVPSESGRLTRTSLPIPANQTHNFWYLHNASDTALVFVHGIFSNGLTCWLHEGNGRAVYWPDLVRVDPRIETPSIYIAGYYTALEAGAFPLDQCARQLLEALERPDVFGRPRVIDKPNLVFLCHSTGGIVVRYLLCRYGKAFAGKGVGLALIASPSRGSVWANIASMAARYYNQKLGQQLRWGGEDIEEIHSRFKDLVSARDTEMPGLFGMEACETRMVFRTRLPRVVRMVLPPRLKVVSTESAGQYFGQVKYLAETDHFSSVKPDALTHPSHEFLETFLRRFRAFLGERPRRDVQQPEPVTDPSRRPTSPEAVARGTEYFASQRQIIAHHLARIVPGRDAESAIDKFVAANRRGYFIVTGSPGLGKTALACQLTKTRDLIHHFIKRQDPRAEPRLILSSLLRQVADRTGTLPEFSGDLPRLTEAFESGLATLARQKSPVLVVVDALDELDDALSADLPFLPIDGLPDGVFMIVTCRPGDRLDGLQERFTDIPWRVHRLTPLSQSEVSRLCARRGRTLTPADLARVGTASAGNPLYLHALIDEIEHDPAFNLTELPAAVEGYFRRAISRVQDRDTAVRILGVLAAARKPMNVRELGAIAALDPRQVDDALAPVRAFLIEVAEGQTFDHQLFREFIRKELLDSAGLQASHAAIASWLLDRSSGDADYRWHNLAFHLYEAGDSDRFHACITDAFLHDKVRRFGFAVLEDVELMTRLMIEAGDPALVERGVAVVESLRRVAGGDLMNDVERAVQFAQVVPRLDSVPVSYGVATPSVDVYVGLIPRIGVSADFVEIVESGACVWAAIGDVPASGLRSAFVARFAANVFRRLVVAAPTAAAPEMLAQVGRTLQPFGNVARMSMQCARIDPAAGVVRFGSAGHPFPVLYSQKRSASDRLPIRGRLLDGEESNQMFYESRSTEIAAGDVLVLVSDGLTEASRLDNPYGYRFMSILDEHASQSARVIGERILADWRAHPRDPEWRDDVTVVVAAVRRAGEVHAY